MQINYFIKFLNIVLTHIFNKILNYYDNSLLLNGSKSSEVVSGSVYCRSLLTLISGIQRNFCICILYFKVQQHFSLFIRLVYVLGHSGIAENCKAEEIDIISCHYSRTGSKCEFSLSLSISLLLQCTLFEPLGSLRSIAGKLENLLCPL